jgi:NB-ARC domain
MTTKYQTKKPDLPRWIKRSSWRRLIFVSIALFFLVAGAIIWILNTQQFIPGPWATVLSIIFVVIGVVLSSLQWLFPLVPIVSSRTSSYSIGQSPQFDADLTIRRERCIQEVYEQLIDSDISAIVLRGLNGVGKSTLASLILHYAERQRLARVGPFNHKALWFYIDANTTIADLAEELSMILKKPLPVLSVLAPQHQAEQLFQHLNTSKMKRLIVLDFKNPLDKQIRDALADRPGFKEFLRILNSQSCYFRILLTSRPWSIESMGDMPVYIKEYSVRNLNESEGTELLRKYNIAGTDEELHSVIELCGGHAGALSLLINSLYTGNISLTTFIEGNTFVQLWMEEVANHYHQYIYEGLNPIQRELLFAFSVYRKPVPIEAVEAIITVQAKRENLQIALLKLIRQDLFLDLDEKNHYQLHAVVANYVQRHLGDTNNQTDPAKLQLAHSKAAYYYLKTAKYYLSLGQHSRRIELLVEAAWHLFQAKMDQEAYDLIRQEDLLKNLLV